MKDIGTAVVDRWSGLPVVARLEVERAARERERKIPTLLDLFIGLRLDRYDVINKHDLT